MGHMGQTHPNLISAFEMFGTISASVIFCVQFPSYFFVSQLLVPTPGTFRVFGGKLFVDPPLVSAVVLRVKYWQQILQGLWTQVLGESEPPQPGWGSQIPGQGPRGSRRASASVFRR